MNHIDSYILAFLCGCGDNYADAVSCYWQFTEEQRESMLHDSKDIIELIEELQNNIAEHISVLDNTPIEPGIIKLRRLGIEPERDYPMTHDEFKSRVERIIEEESESYEEWLDEATSI